ncbi:MAG: hypothetical protein ASARMPRED_003434 [Alectoria sarmentosa]|nr:MAG: hypothetical protein ASARMPRED_003434 [Alectoria sarmentosa]
MAQTLDRLTAARYGVGAVIDLSPEAQVVVDLNNAAMYRGKGKFFYLPEPTQAAPAANPNGLHIRSTVPNLIYLPHQWSQNEKRAHLQLSTGGRFVSVQAQLPHLDQEDVVPINLVMHPRGKHTRYNFSWPLQTLATVVILSTADRMQIASMVEWANAASTSPDGNFSTIQFYTRGQSSHKYYETADAIGKKLEFDGILAELEKKVPPFNGLEEDDGTLSWATIKATLALEAGASAVGGPPTRPMPPSTPGAESKRQTLPMRPISPPASRGKSTCQIPAQVVPRPDDRLTPLISPSAVFIQSQCAAGGGSDEHYDSKVNTSPTKKRRVTSIIELDD